MTYSLPSCGDLVVRGILGKAKHTHILRKYQDTQTSTRAGSQGLVFKRRKRLMVLKISIFHSAKWKYCKSEFYLNSGTFVSRAAVGGDYPGEKVMTWYVCQGSGKTRGQPCLDYTPQMCKDATPESLTPPDSMTPESYITESYPPPPVTTIASKNQITDNHTPREPNYWQPHPKNKQTNAPQKSHIRSKPHPLRVTP